MTLQQAIKKYNLKKKEDKPFFISYYAEKETAKAQYFYCANNYYGNTFWLIVQRFDKFAEKFTTKIIELTE